MKNIFNLKMMQLSIFCFGAFMLFAAQPVSNRVRTHAQSKANGVIEKLNQSVTLTPEQRQQILDWSDRLSLEAQQSDSLDTDKQILYINRNAKGIMRYALDSVYTETQKQTFAIKVQERQQVEINKVIHSTAN